MYEYTEASVSQEYKIEICRFCKDDFLSNMIRRKVTYKLEMVTEYPSFS